MGGYFIQWSICPWTKYKYGMLSCLTLVWLLFAPSSDVSWPKWPCGLFWLLLKTISGKAWFPCSAPKVVTQCKMQQLITSQFPDEFVEGIHLYRVVWFGRACQNISLLLTRHSPLSANIILWANCCTFAFHCCFLAKLWQSMWYKWPACSNPEISFELLMMGIVGNRNSFLTIL